MHFLLRGIISAGRGIPCYVPMEGVVAPTVRPLTVDNLNQDAGAVYPMTDPEYPLWMAATPDNLWYNTSDPQWTGRRVIQMAINRVDSGVGRLSLTDSSFNSSIDFFYDAASASWSVTVDGVEVAAPADHWSTVVTFAVNSTGDVTAMMGDTVLVDEPGFYNGVDFGFLIAWDGSNSISGDEFAAGWYSAAHTMDLMPLEVDDRDWCGKPLLIFELEEPASNQDFVLASGVSFAERHVQVEVIDGGTTEEAAANQDFALSPNVTVLERHTTV